MLNNNSMYSMYENISVLEEPVPFEDFKFSFGNHADFIPNVDDFPPSSSTTMMDPFLQEPFDFITPATTVLDENDQKAFSSFLDAIFLDPSMQPEPLNDNEYHYIPLKQEDGQEEEQRRTFILNSLDEQKKSLITSLSTTKSSNNTMDLVLPPPSYANSLNSGSLTSMSEDTPQTFYLCSNGSIASNYSSSSSCTPSATPMEDKPNKKRALYAKLPATTARPSKRTRANKELLTEDEKRANHIASEQKRRCTIRTGFKDLTELVPTLKHINNSKSTVLFKAVDFIRHLEKRNRSLREKLETLQLRIQVEGHKNVSHKPIKSAFAPRIEQQHHKELPANARDALLAHKSQQKQLMLLQEQLQMHQRLMTQQQEMKDKSIKRYSSNAISAP